MLYVPERAVLDWLLVDAALQAGAELRECLTVEGLLWRDGQSAGVQGVGIGGRTVNERARIVIGAMGSARW